MYEFEDVNTADIRYLIGVPLLFAAIIVLPPARAHASRKSASNITDSDFYRSDNHFHIYSCFWKDDHSNCRRQDQVDVEIRIPNERNSDVRYRGSGG